MFALIEGVDSEPGITLFEADAVSHEPLTLVEDLDPQPRLSRSDAVSHEPWPCRPLPRLEKIDSQES